MEVKAQRGKFADSSAAAACACMNVEGKLNWKNVKDGSADPSAAACVRKNIGKK